MGVGKPVIGLLVVGALASFAFSAFVRQLQDERFRAEFARESASLATDLRRATGSSLLQLDSLARLYRASERVDPDEFKSFVSGILSKHPSIKALEWIPRVTMEQRGTFEGTSWDGFSDPLAITERTAGGRLVSALPRAEYFPVYYVEPREPNVAALGFDLSSESARSMALDRANETGAQSATCPVFLVQDLPENPGIVVVNPIYRNVATDADPVAQRKNLVGYVAGVLQFSDLAHDAFKAKLTEWVGVTIWDVTDPDRKTELFARNLAEISQDSMASIHQFQVAGRKWTLRFVPGKARVTAARTPSPWLILSAGLAMTTLLGVCFNRNSHHALRCEMAEKETSEALDTREAAFEETALLGKITEGINAGHSIGEILDFVYEGFEELIPYDRIGLALVEDSGETIRSRWVRSRQGKKGLGDGYCATVEGSSLKAVFDTGRPRIIDDLPTYTVECQDTTYSHRSVEEGMRSSLTCPLILRSAPVGFLIFSSTTLGAYQSEHVKIFMRVANKLSTMVDKGRVFDALAREEHRSEQLLQSLLPREILARVRNGEKVIADKVASVSVVFADLVGFTGWSRRLDSSALVTLLNQLFQEFDELADKLGIVKIGAQGDCYLAVAGLPIACPGHAGMAAEYALALHEATGRFLDPDGCPLSLRVGIHSGPVVAGVMGKYAWRYDVWGSTVNLASRMESGGEGGRIQVSADTAAQLRGHYRLTPRAPINAKGFGRIQTYWLDKR